MTTDRAATAPSAASATGTAPEPAESARSSFDDRALLAELQAGETNALAALHRRHAPSVYWVARSMVGAADAEDLTQEAFILLWRKSRSVELAGVSVLPWLASTTRYLALNLRKAQARRERHHADVPADAASAESVEEAALAALELDRTERLIAGMPRIDQEVYRLCVVEGLCYKQAARQLQTTQPAVRNRLSRLRATLRKGMAR